MSKKNFQTAPKPKQPSVAQITQFEQSGAGQDKKPQTHIPTNVGQSDEATKRLSIDLPKSVHSRFKTACSATDKKMTKEIERFILKRTQELEKQAQTETA